MPALLKDLLGFAAGRVVPVNPEIISVVGMSTRTTCHPDFLSAMMKSIPAKDIKEYSIERISCLLGGK